MSGVMVEVVMLVMVVRGVMMVMGNGVEEAVMVVWVRMVAKGVMMVVGKVFSEDQHLCLSAILSWERIWRNTSEKVLLRFLLLLLKRFKGLSSPPR